MEDKMMSNETTGEDTTLDTEVVSDGADMTPEENSAGEQDESDAVAGADAAVPDEGTLTEDILETGEDALIEDAGMPAEDMTYDMDGEGMDIGGYVDNFDMMGTETGTQAKDPILSSVPFVAGTIVAALAVGIVLGILLGKKRIKKGFDLYEN